MPDPHVATNLRTSLQGPPAPGGHSLSLAKLANEARGADISGAAGVLALPPNECHLWLTETDDVKPALLARYEKLLCSRERARLAELRTADRAEYLLTRALVRTTLSRYSGIEAADWRFAANSYGRPEVVYPAAAPPISFNLSHTAGLVACAVAWNRPVGVDVERVRERAVLDIAEGVLAEAERDQLLRLPDPQRTERFFALWTLKESYCKARGLGFAIPADEYHFRLDRSPLSFVAPAEDAASSWQFEQLRPTPDHRLAVALQTSAGESIEVVTRHTVPLQDTRW